MNIPSLAIAAHEHYSPELRDKIRDRLRTQAKDALYHLLSPMQFRTLISIESSDALVLTLYLRLNADRRTGHAWHTGFDSMRDTTLKPIRDRRKWQEVKDEFARIEQAVEDELPALGQAVAFFVCRQCDLWQQTVVSVPLPDAVYLRPRPYIRPLVRTRDEHDRFVLAVVSEEHSRFFISQIGQVEEVLQITAPSPRKVARGHHGPRDDKEGSILDSVKHEAQILAHAADLVLSWCEGRYLLLSGATLLRTEVMRELSSGAQQRVGDPFTVEVHARPAEVAAAAEPAQRIIEEREEGTTVQRLIDAGPNASAWDVQPTLSALREGRVRTLVVEDKFAKPGARCRNCLALWSDMRPHCSVCGSDDLEPVDDVVEVAIEQALEEKAALEMVCSERGRQLLTSIGPMAALLRW